MCVFNRIRWLSIDDVPYIQSINHKDVFHFLRLSVSRKATETGPRPNNKKKRRSSVSFL